MESKQGIQSVEVAAPLLRVLAASAGPLALTTLAKHAGMPAAKAHRYLVSLIRVGLVEQDARTGWYDLGSLALELGLASLGRLDAVRLADQALEALRDESGETVALATWGNQGPTYIRLLPSRRAITVNLQIGSVMPLTYTASGLCFCAFLPEAETAELLDAELARNAAEHEDAPRSRADLAPLLDETRRHGLARVIGTQAPGPDRPAPPHRRAGHLLAGFNAFSAPVYDHLGRMQFALTLVGSAVHVDSAWQGAIAQSARRAAAALSARLGYRVDRRTDRES